MGEEAERRRDSFSNFLHAYSTSINDFVCAFDATDSGQLAVPISHCSSIHSSQLRTLMGKHASSQNPTMIRLLTDAGK